MREVRAHLIIGGIVQGIRLRPFVYGLARRHNLRGWVLNNERGFEIEVEGEKENVT